jgi:hypothetical protein
MYWRETLLGERVDTTCQTAVKVRCRMGRALKMQRAAEKYLTQASTRAVGATQHAGEPRKWIVRRYND